MTALRELMSSRPTFWFPDIGYSGYCWVFQRNLSLFFARLYLRSEPCSSNVFRDTDFAGLQVGWNWNFKWTFWPCWVKSNESIYLTRYKNKLNASISCIYIPNEGLIDLYSVSPTSPGYILRPRISQESFCLAESAIKKTRLAFHNACEETLIYLNFPAVCSKMTRFWKRMGNNDKYKRWFIVFCNK